MSTSGDFQRKLGCAQVLEEERQELEEEYVSRDENLRHVTAGTYDAEIAAK